MTAAKTFTAVDVPDISIFSHRAAEAEAQGPSKFAIAKLN